MNTRLKIPEWQQAIQDKCYHPSGTFIPFELEDIEQSIPERFEQQVRKYPHRLAIKGRNEELTYADLNRAANSVAHAILAQCGEANEPVALLLQQSPTAISATLGALKAGKIHVPLDPSYPLSRISSMFEHSQAGLILTNDRNLSLARELAPVAPRVINIDDIESSTPAENIGLRISQDSLAYLLYTSGSTGQPKGVVQTHRNTLYEIMTFTNAIHMCEEDRLIGLYSPSFTSGLSSVLSAILKGSSVLLFNLEAAGLDNLANWLIREEVTIYNSVPTLFRHFMDTLTLNRDDFPSLRLILLGGESVSADDVKLYKRHFSRGCILRNALGSTETGTVRHYVVDQETVVEGSNVPVGYPLGDKEVMILDEDGEEVGFNMIGEITIKSQYLSRGYWRSPEWTIERFLPDPEGGAERIYLTGDMGLMQADGCLMHMGRKDSQVKVRGHRVELGEIEMALLDIGAFKEAVVVAHQDQPADQPLVAYVVPAGKLTPTTNSVRSALSEKLPGYMLPSKFITLDALPLNPNGKVDRRALPPPDFSRQDEENPFVAPRTPVEKKLAKIWAEILGLDEVGIHDNFLELGGHSLLASKIISRVISGFQVELQVRALFESPTVVEMAVAITQNQAKKAEKEDIERMLDELDTISDEQAKRFVSNDS